MSDATLPTPPKLPTPPLPEDFEWTDPGFMTALHDAVYKRLCLQTGSNFIPLAKYLPGDYPLTLTSLPSPTRKSLTVTHGPNFPVHLPLRQLQVFAHTLSIGRYLTAELPAVEPTTVDSSPFVPLSPAQPQPAMQYSRPDQNAVFQAAGISPQGPLRRHDRWINSLGAQGEAGQRARLRDPATRTIRSRVYHYEGGAWTPDPDPKAVPDVVEEFGYIEFGDRLGPWIFNEMLGLLSQLTIYLAKRWDALGLNYHPDNPDYDSTTTIRSWSNSSAADSQYTERTFGNASPRWTRSRNDASATDGQVVFGRTPPFYSDAYFPNNVYPLPYLRGDVYVFHREDRPNATTGARELTFSREHLAPINGLDPFGFSGGTLQRAPLGEFESHDLEVVYYFDDF